jgi:serine/threonine-protein kinase RsbW
MSGPAAAEIVRPAELASLPALLGFTDEACAKAGAGESETFAVRLAVEEVVTNIATHGYAGGPPGPVTLSVSSRPPLLVFTIVDRARPFDPEDAPPPDLTSAWDERRIGGLGWHLVRQMVDEVRYESAAGENRLTLVKRLAEKP